jgi:predicted transcriptional regulator
MVYLHILGSGETKSEVANNKGHLFEKLMRALCNELKMKVERLNKSNSGMEIDILGKTEIGNVPFFSECKAKKDLLSSDDIQKFGFKYLIKREEDTETRGLLFSLSGLNSSADELWEIHLKNKYKRQVKYYLHDEIVDLIIKQFNLPTAEVITRKSTEEFGRTCGDTQLLCIEGSTANINLIWAQLLMSSDSSEPNSVVLYDSQGEKLRSEDLIEKILKLKPDLSTGKMRCLNTIGLPSTLDDIPPSRTVVRVRMSSGWFDYRFPSAPEFFVGRDNQLNDIYTFFDNIKSQKTTSRGLLFTGKSGIGKSSLALKTKDELKKKNIVFVPIDSRLCDDLSFVFDCINELLFELRQINDLYDNLQNISVKGLDSINFTLSEINKILTKHKFYAVIFFDQFEKVFDYPEVTRAIRNIFFALNKKNSALVFGFAWKSDLWSLAEGFPHEERDDLIRESHVLRKLDVFGIDETDEILRELEKLWSAKLNIHLKRQITTFSRGFPWLLKKVCAHILEQKEKGISEEELIETNLKLNDLFEADLSGLDEEEKTLLKAIAPNLPATLQKLSESFEISNIDESLHRFINKRILVKITEDVGGSLANVKYDTYSDIFREFLITGVVPIQEAYYYFNYPSGAFKFFKKIQERGELTINQEIEETGKQVGSIYNLSRDLRNVGLITLKNGVFRVNEKVSNLTWDQIIKYLQSQLKQNRLVNSCLAELNEKGTLSLDQISDIQKELFPDFSNFKATTLAYYSKVTAQWLHYAQLVFYNTKEKAIKTVDDETTFEYVIEGQNKHQSGFNTPVCYKNAIIECLEAFSNLGGSATSQQLIDYLSKSHQSIEKALSDNLNLELIEYRENKKNYHLTPLGESFLSVSKEKRKEIFGIQCENFPVFKQFTAIVEESGETGITSREAALRINENNGFDLADATLDKLGGILANWAEYAGIIARLNKKCYMYELLPEQQKLFK